MSQIEDRVETLLDETKKIRLRSRWPFRIVIALLLLGMAAGLSFFTLRPRTYTATAWIQVLTQRPYFIYSSEERMQYKQYVQTQFSIMRSPLIIDKALEDPWVSKCKTLANLKQQDKNAWLAGRLRLQNQGDSEMITVSISTPVPEDSEKIVNAVVDAFFEYYSNQSNDWNNKLITQLNLEFNRQQAAARWLQDEIRIAMEDAARQGGTGKDGENGFFVSESLLKEISLNESKLTVLRAELKMLRQMLEEGPKVSQSAVWRAVENDRRLNDLFEQKMLVLKNIESLGKIIPSDDPKVLKSQEELKELDKQIAENRKAIEEEKTQSLKMEMIEGLEKEIAEKDRAVRTTDILVKDLKEKYREAIAAVGERTTKIVDISFQQSQLKRVNAVLDLLQERITRLETERNAPEQIQLKKKAAVPVKPDSFWSWHS